MMDKEKIEQRLSELPLYIYGWIDPKALEFSGRIRWICEHECPMYGQSWACPPGVGSVGECQGKCLRYENCLMISTITEVADIANINETLATRGDHEAITNQVGDILREAGLRPYILSTEACALCDVGDPAALRSKSLEDERGYRFPLLRTRLKEGCLVRLMNALPTDLGDRETACPRGAELTTETPEEAERIREALEKGERSPGESTRGHWHRPVT